ncbi:MAG TPA: chromate transporter [Herbaspirillum sp.]|jgi:chromate transporter
MTDFPQPPAAAAPAHSPSPALPLKQSGKSGGRLRPAAKSDAEIEAIMAAGEGQNIPQVSLGELFTTFAMLGSVTFGGMWAASQKIEEMLVRQKGWLTEEVQQTLMIAATVIPSPKFLSFGGLVGYRLRGWLGSVVAVFALVTPGSLLVLAGAALLNPDTVGGALVPINRMVEIGVIGLLFGNAYHQIKSAKVDRRNKTLGVILTLAVIGASIAGVPMLAAAGVGLLLGSLVLRGERTNSRALKKVDADAEVSK